MAYPHTDEGAKKLVKNGFSPGHKLGLLRCILPVIH